MAEKGSFFMVVLFLQVQIDHKMDKKDNAKYFNIPTSPSLHPVLHPCLNQVRLNEVSSNVQAKQTKFLQMKRKENICSNISVSLTKRTKSSVSLSILLSQEKKSIRFSRERQSFQKVIVTYITSSKAHGLHLWLCH